MFYKFNELIDLFDGLWSESNADLVIKHIKTLLPDYGNDIFCHGFPKFYINIFIDSLRNISSTMYEIFVNELNCAGMYEPCKCGRTTVRMENLSGRADDMLVIRGVNVFPGQIEEVLFKIDEIGPHYEILVERKNRLDVMTITVELIDDRLLDSYGQLSELENRIKTRLKSQLGLATQIRLVAPNSLQRFEGKAKRVTDLRKDGL